MGVSSVTRPLVRTAVWLASRALLDPPSTDLACEDRSAVDRYLRSLFDETDGDPEEMDGDTGETDGDAEPSSRGTPPQRPPLPHTQSPGSTLGLLATVVADSPIVLHGSNDGTIETFEPRTQTDWRGSETTAVFATTDPLLAIFFATLDRDVYRGSIRNGGFLVETPTGGVDRRNFFSIVETGATKPFTDGTVYLLPADAFEPAEWRTVGFDEWYCDRPVAPLASIDVTPEDFPADRYLATHREHESVYRSMLAYRWRRRRSAYESG